MTDIHRHIPAATFALAICELGLKNQRLISHYLDIGLFNDIPQLKQVDERLTELLFQVKQSAYSSEDEQREMGITHYVWRTQGDDKVRSSHAVNNGRIFAWDDPPATGHPGEDYNCRCVAEPYKGDIDDPPIEPVYPELILIPLLRLGRIVSTTISIQRRVLGSSRVNKTDKYTTHGAVRASQRKISLQETEEAIKTAKETGNVTTKIGKYGTPRIHYKGSNGVTVIVETEGRNAGKIITFWRRQ